MNHLQNVLEGSVGTQSSYECCGKPVQYFEKRVFGKDRKIRLPCNCKVLVYEKSLEDARKKSIARKREEIFSLSELGSKFESRTFSNWQVRAGTENCSIYSKKFRDSIKQKKKPQSIILKGNPGNGKTELMACVYNDLMEEGYNCIFTTVLKLILKVENSRNFDSKISENQIYDTLKQADAIFLDDFGTEAYKEHGRRSEILFNIIDLIYNHQIPVMLTMNHYAEGKLEANPSLGKVLDRLDEICLTVNNKATSYRSWLAEQRKRDIDLGHK